MADRKITQLNRLQSADVAQADVVAVADVSANETRKVTVPDLVEAGARLMPDGSISGDKIENNTINGNKLEMHSVTGGPTGEIALDTITADNIAPNAIGSSELADGAVDTNALQDGAVTGDKIAADTITANNIAPDAVGAAELADDAVDTAAIQDGAVTGDKLDPGSFDRGIDITAGKVGITNSITPDTQHGITWDEQGLIIGYTTTTPGTDVDIATDTELGVVFVPPAGGLTVTPTGAIGISNTVAAGTGYKITYDEHGLVTASEGIDPDDLPKATDVVFGVVRTSDIPGPIAAFDGELVHRSSTTPGTYTKVIVDTYGLVTTGGPLDASDIPDLSYDQITSGEIPAGALGECAVNGPNICDYATCLMQEDNPGPGDFLGQFWFTPSTSQLRVYARGSGPENIWLPVGFGALQANNLRWGGTYDADSDTIVSLTAIGISEGLTAGQSFPAPTDTLSGIYFICQVAGSSMAQPNLDSINHTAGDWAVCLDQAQGWVHIDANGGGGSSDGGAQYLNDLLDVEIGGAASPFSTAPRVALSADQILRYDGTSGLWRNTDIIDGGSID